MVKLNNAGIFDYIRFILSACLLGFSLFVTSYAIFTQKTGFYKEVPGWAALILFFVVLFLLGIAEGLQLALVELKRQKPETYRLSHPRAYRLGELASQGDNIEKFLVGRQVIVVFLVFFAAKLTSVTVQGQEFLFPVPVWVSSVFLETGLLASIVVVVLAQLTPQIVSSVFPIQFLELRIMRPVYYACLFLEFTGLTHFCWVLVHLLCCVFGMNANKEGRLQIHENYEGVGDHDFRDDDDINMANKNKQKEVQNNNV